MSITIKWINLWIKNFADYIRTKLPSIKYHNSYFAQKQKNQGVKEKKHDFGSLCPHVDVLHHNGSLHRSTKYKIMFLFTDPLRFYPFVQNHCYSTKVKAILYRCNTYNF